MKLAGNAQGTLGIGFRQEDHELLASDASDEIVRAMHAGTQAASQPFEDLVTDRVPIAVVVALEVVGIDDEKGQRSARPPRACPEALQGLLETASVRKPGWGRYTERTQIYAKVLPCLRRRASGEAV